MGFDGKAFLFKHRYEFFRGEPELTGQIVYSHFVTHAESDLLKIYV